MESENNKRIAKNTLLLYVRMFCTLSISLLTSRLVLKALGVGDYGVYNVVGGVVVMLNAFTASLTVATQRYLTYEVGRQNFERFNIIFVHSSLIFVSLSILLVILCETVGIWFLYNEMNIPSGSMKAACIVLQMSLVSTIMSIQIIPYMATIIAYERMSVYAVITIVESVLKLGVALSLYVVHTSRLEFYSVGMAVVAISNMCMYVGYCRHKYNECRLRKVWDYKLFKELLSYSGWNIFASLASMMKGQGLNILLNVFFSPVVNTARAIAVQINNVLNQFFTSFYTAIQPQITKYYATSDIENMNKLVFRGSKYAFFLILFVSTPILFEAPFMIKLWLGQVPAYTVTFTRLIIVVTALDCFSSPLMTAAQATGKIRIYQLSIGLLLMCNVPVSYMVLKFGGQPYSVFVVSCVISLICVFVRIIILSHLYEFPGWTFIKKVVSRIMLTAIISMGGIYIFTSYLTIDGWPRFLSVVFFSLAFTCLVIYYIGADKGERDVIKLTIKSRLHV